MEQRRQYDAVIIGFGKGGKTLSSALAAAGKTVAMVEKSPKMYGGTCINVACLPTKYLVHSAQKLASSCRSFEEKAAAYKDVMIQKDSLIAKLNKANYNNLAENENITVIDGKARFLSPHEIEVDNGSEVFTVEAGQFFINTGAVPVVPPIKGLKDNPYVYVSETMLQLKELPKHLVIIGGGYIGIEFSSIYRQFGSEVTILQDSDRFLAREDEEMADAVREQLTKQGIQIVTGVKIEAVEQEAGQAKVLVTGKDGQQIFMADAVLAATGRRPATDELNLEAAGVKTNERGGIITDEHRMTSTPDIYAMGDVVGGLQFTYISLDDYRIVRSKVLGDGSYTVDKRGAVPYSTFIDPPFSRVGMTEKDAKEAGYEVKVARLLASAIPKAKVMEQTDGLLKAVIDAKTNQILGMHLFCAESHEMINLAKMAMDAKIPYTVLRDTIYTHPTMSEVFNVLLTV
ncbi:pyridine nucleotide-disulfide oxidoreductase [Clostridium sp. chh4-2]|uniref:FAD-dependent oxidoreductase n=1 Tax=Clostridium sp. chh4-2 TaxID=2067550 RepID=UPI000CCE2E30|nr:FAD-dependent oxidoreductase [Clostridium sp. chh4-2]PNV62281.1 pyridine nucleotide-disulfide oxidoreductase [Clostridium sp. chh4-2]